MQADPVILRTYAGGELSPSLAARADLAHYTMGLRVCRNFIVQRHGGVANRPGFRFVGECKTNDSEVRLIRYVSSVPGESVLIEMGELYLRFWYQGALVELDSGSILAYNAGTAYIEGDLVTSGGAIYYCRKAVTGTAPPNATFWYLQAGDILEVPTVFDDPLETRWVQSGQVISFTHEDENPYDLVFETLTAWRMVMLSTEPKVTPPQSVVLNAGAGSLKYGYRVTAAHPATYEESEPSAQVIDAAAADPTDVAPHELSWASLIIDGVACTEYYVYCDPYGNGTYGYIGTANGLLFRNPGITPDFSQTPPLARDLFEGGTQFPAVCGYHQQRRYFANFPGGADTLTGSRVGFPDNFGISSPLQDDDAITARIAGNNHHAIRWLVALKDLLVMTDGGEWRMIGTDGIITPNTIAFDQETYVGIHDQVAPIVVGNTVIYVQARGSIVRDLRFEQDVEGLAGRDLTVFASHLVDGYTLVGGDFQQAPHSVIWLVRSDGTLLGLTYLRDQDVWGWHRHDTDGEFEDARVVPEPGEDALYVIVRRVIGGDVVRYIEKLERRTNLDYEDSFFVDSGLTYDGAPTSSVSGLDHLVGETVAVVGDGEYLGTRVVSLGGAISLGGSYSKVHAGLPIEADLETLNLDVAGSDLADVAKRVQSLGLVVDVSARHFQAGPDADHLTRYVAPNYESEPDPFTGIVELPLVSRFSPYGRVFVRQDYPLPLTVLAMVPRVEVGE